MVETVDHQDEIGSHTPSIARPGMVPRFVSVLFGVLMLGGCATNPVATFSEGGHRVDQVVAGEMGRDKDGGMVITADGTMVVALTETPDSRVVDLIETAARSRTVRVIPVKYSFDQLVAWAEQVEAGWALLPGSWWIDVEQNKIRLAGESPDLPLPPDEPSDAIDLSESD